MKVEYVEKGSGHKVILLHSTAATNRQWKKLIELLHSDYNLIAPNLFGYGGTDCRTSDKSQTLADQAEIIRQFIPEGGEKFSLVGHSFGGSVAMMAGKLFRQQLNKLVLIEPNPNYLLKVMGKMDEFNEIVALRDCIKINGSDNK